MGNLPKRLRTTDVNSNAQNAKEGRRHCMPQITFFFKKVTRSEFIVYSKIVRE